MLWFADMGRIIGSARCGVIRGYEHKCLTTACVEQLLPHSVGEVGQLGAVSSSLVVCGDCRRHLDPQHFRPLFSASSKITGEVAIVVHPVCDDCRDRRAAEVLAHIRARPGLARVVNLVMWALRDAARKRKVLVGLLPEDVAGLHKDQGGRCALSGVELDCSARSKAEIFEPLAPRVDRIDPRDGYVVGNVHLVANVVASMRSGMPIDRFVGICQAVSAHQLERSVSEVV